MMTELQLVPTDTRPAWDRFHDMTQEVHGVLIGAAQCRNYLQDSLACWDECDDAERRRMIEESLERLTRVGV